MQYLDAISHVNLPATAVAALAMLVLSGLWVSPLLFGRAWIRLSGIRPGDIRPADARRNLLVSVFTSLVASVLIGLVAAHAGQSKPMLFGGIGFLWLFVMLEQLHQTVWQRHPFALFLLQTFRSLAALMAGGAVFYFWS